MHLVAIFSLLAKLHFVAMRLCPWTCIYKVPEQHHPCGKHRAIFIPHLSYINIKSSSLNPELEVYNQYCLDVSLADFLVIAAEAVIASTRARYEDASPGHRWGHGKIGRNLGGC